MAYLIFVSRSFQLSPPSSNCDIISYHRLPKKYYDSTYFRVRTYWPQVSGHTATKIMPPLFYDASVRVFNNSKTRQSLTKAEESKPCQVWVPVSGARRAGGWQCMRYRMTPAVSQGCAGDVLSDIWKMPNRGSRSSLSMLWPGGYYVETG